MPEAHHPDTKMQGGTSKGREKRKIAFTLAEVLITLGIIGIIAAMTLPTLIQKHQEKQTVSQLKKFYSVMNSAYMMAKNEYGSIDNWGLTKSFTNSAEDNADIINSNTSLDKFIDTITPYLKVTSKCYYSDSSCSTYEAKNLAGKVDTSDTYAERIKLSDGSIIGHIFINSPSCSLNWGSGALSHFCGSFKLDINGKKEPNTYGKDIFQFYITKDAIIPSGTDTDNYLNNFDTACVDSPKRLNGLGCTAWVIYNENLDYLKCPDKLGWDKQQKCN